MAAGRAHDYCVDGQVYTAASAVRWVIELGLVVGANQLDAVAAAGRTAAVSCAFLRWPDWPRRAGAQAHRGSFTGMTLSNHGATWSRAVARASPHRSARWPTRSPDDLGPPLTRLRVDGGLTRSAVLMQAQADLLQLPGRGLPVAHATPLGVAACARLALGARPPRRRRPSAGRGPSDLEPTCRADEAAERLARSTAALRATGDDAEP